MTSERRKGLPNSTPNFCEPDNAGYAACHPPVSRIASAAAATIHAVHAYCLYMDRPAHDAESGQSENDLVRKARRGDRDAFEQLYRRHAKAIHALALRLTGNHATAQDITQDAFMRLFQFLGGIRNDAPLRPWLKRVASNLAIDHLRRERPQLTESWDEQQPETTSGPSLHAETSGLLQRLPPLVRTVVWLHEMEGWSHPELARRFGRSQSWSKSILARGLARLRSELDEEQDGASQDEHTPDH